MGLITESGLTLEDLYYRHQTLQSLYKFQGHGKEKCSIIPQGGKVTTLDLSFAGTGETRVISVESITYKYINGKLAQEYGATWGVSSSQLPQGSQLEVSEAKATLTITVPANNTSSTRSGKVVLIQKTSGKTITITITQKALDPIIKLELSFADQSSALVDQGPVPYTLNYNDQFLETGTIPAGGAIQVPQNTWADNGGDTAIYTLYMKGSEIKAGSTFYFQCRFYAINGWEGLLVDPEYNKALNYKIDTVQPTWNPSGTIQSGTIYLYKGNLSPSDFSGGILIELTLGTKINGYVKKAMIRIKVNQSKPLALQLPNIQGRWYMQQNIYAKGTSR